MGALQNQSQKKFSRRSHSPKASLLKFSEGKRTKIRQQISLMLKSANNFGRIEMSEKIRQGQKLIFIAYFFPPAESTEVPGAMRTVKFIRNIEGGEKHVLTTTPRLDESKSALKHIHLPANDEHIHRVKPWDIFQLLLAIRARAKRLLKKGISNSSITTPSTTSTTFKSSSHSSTKSSKFQQLKDFIYNLCYFPDQAGPWILPAYLYGKTLVNKQGIDVIFATGSPWSGLFVGYLISKATGKPFIADFRDPWMNNPFHQSKGTLLDRWSVRMERAIVQHAAAVSLNTDPLRDEFLERYPDIPEDKFFVMPNGFDPADFQQLEQQSNVLPDQDWITFCHAGFLYGVRDPAALLDAIRNANKALKNATPKLRFRQIGEIQLAYDIKERYASMLEDGSLQLDAARPYQECLQELQKADWVVNIQPATRSQVPSKLYDYLAINRPILNITPTDGALGQIATRYQIGEVFGFDESDKITQCLLAIAEQHRKGGPFNGYPNRGLFDCRIISEKLVERIEHVCRNQAT